MASPLVERTFDTNCTYVPTFIRVGARVPGFVSAAFVLATVLLCASPGA